MQALLLTRYYSGDQIRVRWLGLRERTTWKTGHRWKDSIKMIFQEMG